MTRAILSAAAVAAFLLSAFCPMANAEWEYVRAEDKGKGTLTVSTRRAATGALISVRQFCYAFGCRVLYQWSNYRAVIQNPEEQVSGIVSALTGIAIVDGRVIDFEGQVVSDLREGYLLPMSLAMKLAPALKLGKVIEKKETEVIGKKPKPEMALKTIVIDPGHGGNDWGTGVGGIHEKDVAIIYAFKLRDELKAAMPDLEIHLTRDSDRYVSLPDRAKFANAKNANLFLSLHVNHAHNTRVEGTETYILSPDATDDEAKKVALLENESWLKTAKINDAGDTIRKILIDMEQTRYIQGSALAASMIQQELAGLEPGFGLKSRGVKQAMFYVLSQVAMPSALVEMGFLSNTGDRSRLMNINFRDEFVKRIVSGIKRYREKAGTGST